MAKSADEKRSKILDVAKRRFAHYGLAKTTMAEIAKDLAFSKALLYYYFPDKNNLYIAVIEDIIDEMDETVRSLLTDNLTIIEAVFIFLETRKEIVSKYFYIIEYTLSFKKEVPIDVEEVLLKSYSKQVEVLDIIFERGVKAGALIEMDITETSNIFLNACGGMRMVILKNFKKFFTCEKEEFDSVLVIEKQFASIFIKGLMK